MSDKIINGLGLALGLIIIFGGLFVVLPYLVGDHQCAHSASLACSDYFDRQ